MNEHFRKLQNMYLKAKCQTSYYETITINISEQETIITLDISDKYFHALGAIHGSIYFKLLDDASFFAVNARVKDVFVLTTSFNINIIKPVNSGTIKAIGKVKHEGRNIFVGEASLYNDKDQLIGFGTGNFTRSRIELTEKIGYR